MSPGKICSARGCRNLAEPRPPLCKEHRGEGGRHLVAGHRRVDDELEVLRYARLVAISADAAYELAVPSDAECADWARRWGPELLHALGQGR